MQQVAERIMITVVDEGVAREAVLDTGQSLLGALQSSNIPIGSVCGGQMSCGTCHVYLPEAETSDAPIDPDETALLEDVPGYRPGRSRLACQVKLTAAMNHMRIEIAPDA